MRESGLLAVMAQVCSRECTRPKTVLCARGRRKAKGSRLGPGCLAAPIGLVAQRIGYLLDLARGIPVVLVGRFYRVQDGIVLGHT